MKNAALKIFVGVLIAASAAGPLIAQAQEADVNSNNTPGALSSPTTSALPSNATQTLANAQTAIANTSPNTSPNSSDDIGCGTLSGNGIAICLSDLVYYPMVGLGSWFVYIAAFIFDYAIQLALSSTSYALDFIATTWGIVRDVANMSFLFILLYIGYVIMLKAETAGTMRMLVGVVVVALLVNFSFFTTRAVIDAGNILAVQFYNAIGGPNAPTISATSQNSTTLGPSANVIANGGNTKDLTAAIMNSLQVQTLTSTQSFQNYVKSTQSSAMYTLISLSLIYVAMGVIFFILAGSFLYAGAKFVIRIVGLWCLIIVSPLAFVSAIFQWNKSGFLKNGFQLWLTYLLKLTFYPAIYLFMFWIITVFAQEMGSGDLLNSVFNAANGSTTNSFGAIGAAIANVGVRLGFFIAMMYIALSVADKVADYAKGTAGWFQQTVLSGAAGGFIGGLGRGTLGNAGRFAVWNANRKGEPPSRTAEFLANRTYDVRNVPIVGTGTKRGLGLVTRGVENARNAVKIGVPVDFGTPKNPTEPWRASTARAAAAAAAAARTGAAGAATGTATATATATGPVARPIPAPTRTAAANSNVAGSMHSTSNMEGSIKLEQMKELLRKERAGRDEKLLTIQSAILNTPTSNNAALDEKERQTLVQLAEKVDDIAAGTPVESMKSVLSEIRSNGQVLRNIADRPEPPSPAAPAAQPALAPANDNQPPPRPADGNIQQIPKAA